MSFDSEYAKVTIIIEVGGKTQTRTYPVVVNPLLHEEHELSEQYLGAGLRLPRAILATSFTFSGTALRDEHGVVSLTQPGKP